MVLMCERDNMLLTTYIKNQSMLEMQRYESCSPCIVAALALTFCLSHPVFAQQSAVDIDANDNAVNEYVVVPQFGGPASVGGQVNADQEKKRSAYHFEGLSRSMQPFYDFKEKIKEENGFAFGGDYQSIYQKVSESPGEDHAAGGIIRFYGSWTVLGHNAVDKGTLVFKVENRHRLGTDIAPQQLGAEIGYAGLTAIVYSDAGTLLTNLYWQQSFKNNQLAFLAGIVDATDYLNLYGLVNPWTDFSNLSFSTDATIPVPNQGLGAAVRGTFLDNYYVLAGFTDANGDPAKTQDSLDGFFDENEYFKHIELGWFASWQDNFTDNIHLTVWQVDERKNAQVNDGWGSAFSFSRKINQRWLPFFRAGYSDGGGAFLQRSLTAGIGYFSSARDDVLGVGINWGQPSKETYGDGLDDQYTAEVFYRMQLFQHVTVTPDVQLLINPALNPDEDSIWVAGLRARVVF